MRRSFIVPSPNRDNLTRWATDVHNFLREATSGSVEPQTILLQSQIGGEKATTEGLMMWDPINGYPVVSHANVWREIVLADGQFMGTVSTDQLAVAINTAYALTYSVVVAENGIATDPANPSRIVFEEGGEYLINFSAQLSAGSSNDVTFYFWPKINGVNVAGSTMVNTMKNNGAQVVTARSALFDFNAGDYVEAFWAVTSLSGYLHAVPATAFCPAAPATTISISRIRK